MGVEDQYGCKRRCLYRHRSSSGIPSFGQACDYMLITGKSRLKQLPDIHTPSKRCPLFIPDDEIRQARRRNNPSVPPWEQQALQMHAEGAPDEEIARAVGLSKATIVKWRRSRSLKINSTYQRPISDYDWNRARELYDAGKNDRAIAEAMGCSHTYVYRWRKREGLPGNGHMTEETKNAPV